MSDSTVTETQTENQPDTPPASRPSAPQPVAPLPVFTTAPSGDPLEEVREVIARETGGATGAGLNPEPTLSMPAPAAAIRTPRPGAPASGNPASAAARAGFNPAPSPSNPTATLASSPTFLPMEAPDQDARLLAALAHLSMLFSPFVLGFGVPALIYYFWRDRSAYVRFQAAQALAYHLCFAAFTWAAVALIGGLIASIIGILLLVIVVPFAALGFFAMIGYAFWAVLQTLQGRPFQYAVIGEHVREWLAQASEQV